MVTLNFTLVVELGLFLLFLWGTSVFFIKPVLRHLDERDAEVESDREAALNARSEAERLEGEYTQQLAQIRRTEEDAFRAARQAAIDDFHRRMAEKRRESEAALEALRQDAAAQFESERPRIAHLSKEMADTLAQRLNLTEGRS